jgi:hypothetical protein
MLVKPVREPKDSQLAANHNLAVHKQAFYSIAKCVAALTVNNQKDGQNIITQFVEDIKVIYFLCSKLKISTFYIL